LRIATEVPGIRGILRGARGMTDRGQESDRRGRMGPPDNGAADLRRPGWTRHPALK
jgi:hypothetical protein